MRDYGKVYSNFWVSETARSLSDEHRLLALYLMTSQHGTITGVFRMPDGYVCEDIGWTNQRVSKGFSELFRKGFCNRCETTKWVWIYKHLVWNRPENPNQWKAAKKIADMVPDNCSWTTSFKAYFENLFEVRSEPFFNPFETVSKPVTVTETVAVTVAETEGTLPGKPDDAIEVLDYLNQVSGKNFRKVESNIKLICARLEQYSIEDLKQVVDLKCKQWLGNPKCDDWVRPSTLFGKEKCSQYTGEIGKLSAKEMKYKAYAEKNNKEASDQNQGSIFEGDFTDVTDGQTGVNALA